MSQWRFKSTFQHADGVLCIQLRLVAIGGLNQVKGPHMELLKLLEIALDEGLSPNSYSIFVLDFAFHMDGDPFDGLVSSPCLLKLILRDPEK